MSYIFSNIEHTEKETNVVFVKDASLQTVFNEDAAETLFVNADNLLVGNYKEALEISTHQLGRAVSSLTDINYYPKERAHSLSL